MWSRMKIASIIVDDRWCPGRVFSSGMIVQLSTNCLVIERDWITVVLLVPSSLRSSLSSHNPLSALWYSNTGLSNVNRNEAIKRLFPHERQTANIDRESLCPSFLFCHSQAALFELLISFLVFVRTREYGMWRKNNRRIQAWIIIVTFHCSPIPIRGPRRRLDTKNLRNTCSTYSCIICIAICIYTRGL